MAIFDGSACGAWVQCLGMQCSTGLDSYRAGKGRNEVQEIDTPMITERATSRGNA